MHEPVSRRAPDADACWARPAEDVATSLGSGPGGLSSKLAESRLRELGPNEIEEQRSATRIGVFLRQLRSPLVILLLIAAIASAAASEWIDSAIVFVIVLGAAAISGSREFSAENAVEKLRASVRSTAKVRRDGANRSVPLREVVPGDVVLLGAGSIVPADGRLLEATDLFVNQAVLTGESFPVEKTVAPVARAAGLPERTNCVYLGTNVRSGTGRFVVVDTGTATRFGAIAHKLVRRPPETEFERGLRRFGNLLTASMLVMVLVVFAVNVLLGRPVIATLTFAIALAVGLSPELLPAILMVNLARSAQAMALRGVVVRRLHAIESLGGMDVLCTDKTGTLTEGVVELDGAFDSRGNRSDRVLELGARNAALQTGLANPLDQAILAAHAPDLADVRKIGEVPYDFVRKRLGVAWSGSEGDLLVTKGAFEPILATCTRADDGSALDEAKRRDLTDRYVGWGRAGTRVLAVAIRKLASGTWAGRSEERDLEFAGFLTFSDRTKRGAGEAVAALQALGVTVKLVTGDSGEVARHVAKEIGLDDERVLTGRQLDELNDEALWNRAEATSLFVEVDPNQKERIIRSLRKSGHVVGFLGDGVNDAPAMHAADTSLSVEHAADVAREAADFILTERDLFVVRDGIVAGRRTFANTLKYLMTTMSANLGNMVSMAAASLFLPFLPLLPGQILLNNFLSDVPAFGLASDRVDPELVARPRRWDVRFIGRFMVGFGLLSSLFDMLTFAALLGMFAAPPTLFRTAWFVESLLTELAVALVVRTRRPLYRSRPGAMLAVSTALVALLAFALPYLPFAGIFGFTAIPAAPLLVLVAITVLYVAAAEIVKRSMRWIAA